MSIKHVPQAGFLERGSKQWSSRSPQRDGRVCRWKSVSSFFLLLPNILIAATLWRVSLCRQSVTQGQVIGYRKFVT